MSLGTQQITTKRIDSTSIASDNEPGVAASHAEKIIDSLKRAQDVTESAVLAIGNQVNELVTIAQADAATTKQTIQQLIGCRDEDEANSELGIAELIETQKDYTHDFVNTTRRFFCEHVELASSAGAACESMEERVESIESLVFSSQVLAFNVQIESSRLGEHGKSFSVIGEEMVRFSEKVSFANHEIKEAVETLNKKMTRIHQESELMDQKLKKFSEQLDVRVNTIESRIEALTGTLNETLDQISSSNRKLIANSQLALSELQFQDPLAQDLKRTEREVLKLKNLAELGTLDESLLPEPDPTVGNEGTEFREAGLVDLF